MDNVRMTVKEASEIMGIPAVTLRQGLEEGKFPFGVGFYASKGSSRRTFYISRPALEKYIKGE